MRYRFEPKYTRPQLEIFFDHDPTARFITCGKGRRFGATHGAMLAICEWLMEGERVLWGDTITANIAKYVERYAFPTLRKFGIPYNWNAQKKELQIFEGIADFRSADRPENWEGFGYNRIILNEAGIILKNEYLYTNAVLPMLMDYENAKLYAIGVPKGKFTKNNKEHRYYTICKNGMNKVPGYQHFQFSSYDNPLLRTEDIAELEAEISNMSPEMVRQEIYGEFIDLVQDALFNKANIDAYRLPHAPEKLDRTVVAIDPAMTSDRKSDETGIVAVGKKDKIGYVLGDYSGKYSPHEWAKKAIFAYDTHKADMIVAEVNQGGDLVLQMIRSIRPNILIKKIHASKGKVSRAEPVSAYYEQGLVRHCGIFTNLEAQMCLWSNKPNESSPDRMDALVYGVTEVMQDNLIIL